MKMYINMVEGWFLVALLATSQAMALDINGVELGKPATQAALLSLGLDGCLKFREQHRIKGSGCDGLGSKSGTVDGVPITANVSFDQDNRVNEIRTEFPAWRFDEVLARSIAKWGNPECEQSSMQNGFGARVTQTQCLWRRSDGSMILAWRYGPKRGSDGGTYDIKTGLLIIK
jgi:hypothetical protein